MKPQEVCDFLDEYQEFVNIAQKHLQYSPLVTNQYMPHIYLAWKVSSILEHTLKKAESSKEKKKN